MICGVKGDRSGEGAVGRNVYPLFNPSVRLEGKGSPLPFRSFLLFQLTSSMEGAW